MPPMTSFALLCHVGRKERRKEDQLMKKQESQRHTAELMGRVHHHENTMKINKQQRKHMSHTARFSRNPVTQPTHFFFFRLGSQGRNGVSRGTFGQLYLVIKLLKVTYYTTKCECDYPLQAVLKISLF